MRTRLGSIDWDWMSDEKYDKNGGMPERVILRHSQSSSNLHEIKQNHKRTFLID